LGLGHSPGVRQHVLIKARGFYSKLYSVFSFRKILISHADNSGHNCSKMQSQSILHTGIAGRPGYIFFELFQPN